jgi:hypothetical protein
MRNCDSLPICIIEVRVSGIGGSSTRLRVGRLITAEAEVLLDIDGVSEMESPAFGQQLATPGRNRLGPFRQPLAGSRCGKKSASGKAALQERTTP